MTEHGNDKHDTRLEALYREAGDVEPDAGLDRIIRARADEAVRVGRSSNRLTWLGGLVTASVSIIAIAVVLQQAPPGEPALESPAPQQSRQPEAFMAPSMGAQSRQKVSADANSRYSETLEAEQSPGAARTEQARRSRQELTTEEHERLAERPGTEIMAPSLGSNDSVQDRMMVTGSGITAADLAGLEPGETLIAKLRELIKEQRIEEARRLLEEAAELEPKLELPEDIEQALKSPE